MLLWSSVLTAFTLNIWLVALNRHPKNVSAQKPPDLRLRKKMEYGVNISSVSYLIMIDIFPSNSCEMSIRFTLLK